MAAFGPAALAPAGSTASIAGRSAAQQGSNNNPSTRNHGRRIIASPEAATYHVREASCAPCPLQREKSPIFRDHTKRAVSTQYCAETGMIYFDVRLLATAS